MIDTVVIVRHDQRLDKVDKEWPLTSACPWDTPLSGEGLLNAEQLAKELLRADISQPVTLYTSPFLRCAQTAGPIARELGVKMRMCCVFGEWMTPDYFEHGAPPSDNHAAVAASSKIELIRGFAANVDFTWDLTKFGDAGPYGETWTEMHQRAAQGIDRALQEGDGTLIVVSHGSLCNGIIAHLRGVPQMGIIGMGEYVVIRR